MFIVLGALYQQRTYIRTYTSQEVVFYFLMVGIIQGITSTHFESWRVEEIRLGKIDGYLTRPFSYLKEIILSDLAGKLFYLMLFTPFYFIFFQVVQRIAPFEIPAFHPAQIWIFLMLLVFAYFMELCFALLVVLIGFWFEGSQGLEHFKWISITLFSGSMLPIPFLPKWLQSIVNQLPFKYMYSVPINILQSRTYISYPDIAFILGSVTLLSALVWICYKKAVFLYTSSGG